MFYEILQKKLKNSSNWSSLKDFFMGHVEIRFLHGPCGNQISAWAMWKSDFFSLVQMNFTIFWKCMEIFQWPSLILTHTGIRIFLLMNINSCILYFCKFTRKCPIVKPNNNSVFSFSSSRQDRKTGGIFFSKKIGKVNSFYRNDRYYPKMQVVGIKCSFFK